MYCFSTYWVNFVCCFILSYLKSLSCISREVPHAQSPHVVSGCCLEQQMENTCVITEGAVAQHASGTVDCRVRDAWSASGPGGRVTRTHGHLFSCFQRDNWARKTFCWPVFLECGVAAEWRSGETWGPNCFSDFLFIFIWTFSGILVGR